MQDVDSTVSGSWASLKVGTNERGRCYVEKEHRSAPYLALKSSGAAVRTGVPSQILPLASS